MNTGITHNLSREEWVRRFGERIREKGFTPENQEALADVIDAELESWPEEKGPICNINDWRVNIPENAADENMEGWAD